MCILQLCCWRLCVTHCPRFSPDSVAMATIKTVGWLTLVDQMMLWYGRAFMSLLMITGNSNARAHTHTHTCTQMLTRTSNIRLVPWVELVLCLGCWFCIFRLFLFFSGSMKRLSRPIITTATPQTAGGPRAAAARGRAQSDYGVHERTFCPQGGA